MPDGPWLLALIGFLGTIVGVLGKYVIDTRLNSGSVRTSNAETVFSRYDTLVARIEKRLEECESDRTDQGIRLDRLARDNRELDEKIFTLARDNRLLREDVMILQGKRAGLLDVADQVASIHRVVSETLVKTTAIDNAVNGKAPGMPTISDVVDSSAAAVETIRVKQETDKPSAKPDQGR